MANNQNTVTKLSITGYGDEAFSSKVIGPFELQINPDSISQSYSVELNNDGKSCKEKDVQGGIKSSKYKGSNPSNLNIETTLDGTGLVEGIEYGGLPDYVGKLLKVVHDYNGEAHRTLYLKVEWGSVFRDAAQRSVFRGQLSMCTINYTLFSPDGVPLRAKLSMSLVEALSEKELEKLEKKSSPDMSHVITVREGDKLPALCKSIYGSGAYYLQVARVNGLSNLFSLRPGQQLYFPPLEK